MKKSDILEAARQGARVLAINVYHPFFNRKINSVFVYGEVWCSEKPRKRKGDEVVPCGPWLRTNVSRLSRELDSNRGEKVTVQFEDTDKEVPVEYDTKNID
ncbi:MAG: hypothetical protein PUF37_00770 [Prevotellaceae bacterium]|nr:hypothetical protein [Prevotellaceae bacterium]